MIVGNVVVFSIFLCSLPLYLLLLFCELSFFIHIPTEFLCSVKQIQKSSLLPLEYIFFQTKIFLYLLYAISCFLSLFLLLLCINVMSIILILLRFNMDSSYPFPLEAYLQAWFEICLSHSKLQFGAWLLLSLNSFF